jgi:hypothetical protein
MQQGLTWFKRMSSNVEPIFVLGIKERSGTNYLFHLLCLHPSVSHGGPIWENYILDRIDVLKEFVTYLFRTWHVNWDVSNAVGSPQLLCELLGRSLVTFLNRQLDVDGTDLGISRKLVTKSPSVENIELFFEFFPKSKLIVIVRDGRDLVESGIRTFGWDFEQATREWSRAAHTIINFLVHQGANPNFKLIRYEDLVTDTELTLKNCLRFLGLNTDEYDFSAAKNLPVVGSSSVVKGYAPIHWHPQPKENNFNSVGRWKHWSWYRNVRFNWIAADYMREFRYDIKKANGPKFLLSSLNLFLDIIWWLKRKFS